MPISVGAVIVERRSETNRRLRHMATGSDTSKLDPRAALTWLAEMGADEFIGEEPVDRFAAGASPLPTSSRPPGPPLSRGRADDIPTAHSRASGSPPPAPQVERASPGPDGALTDARTIAEACQSLGDLAEALKGFDACPLQRTATNLVYMDGNPQARILCIGEAPGRDEDLQGKPFVGRSGQLLDRMLAAIGLSRASEDPSTSVLITNVIFWRPPGNRKPTEAETLMCMPFVLRTLALVDPQIIVCLGATPAQRLLGLTDGILKLRGRWRPYRIGEREVPLMPTLHPAYLLRQPLQKRLAWRDLVALRKRLDG